MHDSTIAGVDPPAPYLSVSAPRDANILEISKPGSAAHKAATERLKREAARTEAYEDLTARYIA